MTRKIQGCSLRPACCWRRWSGRSPAQAPTASKYTLDLIVKAYTNLAAGQ